MLPAARRLLAPALRPPTLPTLPTLPSLPHQPPLLQGPIYICTTNDALPQVLASVPRQQRRQLVFFQNGMLLPWLQQQGLQGSTQVLLYMSGALQGRLTGLPA